jgi:hypothetical protein
MNQCLRRKVAQETMATKGVAEKEEVFPLMAMMLLRIAS